MQSVLLITVRFLTPDPTFHGQSDGGQPEWPPSPLRLFQALVDAASNHWRGKQFEVHAQSSMVWLERLGQPDIAAPIQAIGTPFRIAVPNNDLDVWAGPMSKGNQPKKQPNELKTMKQVCPVHLNGDTVHYLYALPADSNCSDSVNVLTIAARSITHLGWGIDMAVGDASVITTQEAAKLEGVRWRPSPTGGTPLRVSKVGTLDDLTRKHADFLNRVTEDGFRPVPPLRVFDVVRYRPANEPAQRPYHIFELRNLDGTRFRYPHRRLIHIAGMVRHLAIKALKNDSPRGVSGDWVETYIAGHRKGGDTDVEHRRKCDSDRQAAEREAVGQPDADDDQHHEAFRESDVHRQLSYLPLPSIGHPHADPGVRRVMIAAPIGDDALLDYVALRLAGRQLEPVRGDEFGFDEEGNPNEPPILVRMRGGDGVIHRYTQAASEWHSFTPVILPGHDDRKPGKTRELIEKALRQSGIEQPCEFEWSPFSRFAKSYSAHKYDRQKRPQGYIRPRYLLSQTAVHLTLRFHDGSTEKNPVVVPGPITIGAGRHCGLGIFAAVPNQETDDAS